MCVPGSVPKTTVVIPGFESSQSLSKDLLSYCLHILSAA